MGNITDGIPTVECECPKCGTKHKLKMLWIGRGEPKKFCAKCKNVRNEISDIHTEIFYDWRVRY